MFGIKYLQLTIAEVLMLILFSVIVGFIVGSGVSKAFRDDPEVMRLIPTIHMVEEE